MFTKKILAFLLILLVSAPIFFSVGFTIKQKAIQASMKQQLKSALLQTVVIPLKDVKWIKPGKEILVAGQMFDIKSSTLSANEDYVVFTGLYDEDEQKLHNSLKDFIQHKNKKTSASDDLLAKFFSLVTTLPPCNNYSFTICKNSILKHVVIPAKIPTSPAYSIYQPPRS